MIRLVTTTAALSGALLLGSCTYQAPDCTASELIKSATDVVNGNEDVKAHNVTVKEIRGMKETAHDDDKKTRQCKGEMELSNGQIMDLQIDLAQDPKDEKIFIPTVRWSPKE